MNKYKTSLFCIILLLLPFLIKAQSRVGIIDSSFITSIGTVYHFDTAMQQGIVLPEYSGGKDAMLKFLASNIRYPTKARENNIEGKVIIEIIVQKDGNLSNSNVIQSVGGGCDDEVIRIINRMPTWKAGSINGQPVNVYYRIPVSFRMDNSARKSKRNK